MGLIDAVGPGLVALGVLGLPVLAAVRRRRWSVVGVGPYLLSVVLVVVWTAKSVVIADSSHDDPPAWPALPWMLVAVVAAGVPSRCCEDVGGVGERPGQRDDRAFRALRSGRAQGGTIVDPRSRCPSSRVGVVG